jgi:hypothetical protein
VHDIHDAASRLVGPLKNVFSISGHPKETLVANWGLAAIVYSEPFVAVRTRAAVYANVCDVPAWNGPFAGISHP